MEGSWRFTRVAAQLHEYRASRLITPPKPSIAPARPRWGAARDANGAPKQPHRRNQTRADDNTQADLGDT